MKLAYKDMEHVIEFHENQVEILLLESQDCFSKFIEELYLQIQNGAGPFVFSEENCEINVSKWVNLIIEPFTLNINSKPILSKVMANVKLNALGENHYLRTLEMKGLIKSYIMQLTDVEHWELSVSENVDLDMIFKSVNLKIFDDYISLLEKIVSYVISVNDILGINIFIFTNLNTYLSMEELSQLYTECFYRKIFLLLVENNLREYLPCENVCVIDKELCEIY